MELRQLLSFMEIAKCENLSQAAANLYISQPALSKQIQNLESELNTKLFRRTSNGMFLNPAGRCLLKYCHEIFKIMDLAKKELLIYTDNSILTDLTFCALDYPPIRHTVPAFSDAFPSVRIHLKVDGRLDMEKLLLDGSADIALSKKPISNPNLRTLPLYDENAGIQVHKSHPLAHAKSLSLQEIADYEILSLLEGDSAQEYFTSIQKAGNDRLRMRYITDPMIYLEKVRTNKYGSGVKFEERATILRN